MKACGYCGRENDDSATFCTECGTAFEVKFPPAQVPAFALATRLRELNAWSATAILLFYLAANIISIIVVGLVALLGLKAQGTFPVNPFEDAIRTAMPLISILMPISSAIATILAARILVRSSVRDTTAIGAAWVGGSWQNTAKGVAIGMFIAAGTYTISMLLFEIPAPFRRFSQLERMVVIPGLSQVLYGVTVIVVAPFSEEILFRGVLYGGYRRSLGAFGATALTTGLFCLLHLTQIIHYAPVLLGLVAGSLAALALRLLSGAVGPAIGVHVGHNAWFFALALLKQHTA